MKQDQIGPAEFRQVAQRMLSTALGAVLIRAIDAGGSIRNLCVGITAAFVAICPVFAADTKDPTSFLCVPDYATGYGIGRSGKWEPVQFSVQGKKYLLKKIDERWFWAESGRESDAQRTPCEAFNDLGFTVCKPPEDQVMFNRKTLRFQIVHFYGYVTSDIAMDKEPASPPYYLIGKCSAQ